jgi:hypothetical protein
MMKSGFLLSTVHRRQWIAFSSVHSLFRDVDQYGPQIIQLTLHSTLQRLSSGRCLVMSTEYLIDVAQNIKWKLLTTVHRLFSERCSVISI